MNRRHKADDYRRIVDRLRRARPDIALSSDFIVGFPGERDQECAATIGLVTAGGYAQALPFKYRPRPGTPAAAAEQAARKSRGKGTGSYGRVDQGGGRHVKKKK